MFLIIQFPLADVRPFLAETPARLPLPTWPIPREGTEFVHHFGFVQRRRGGTGGVERWSDDLFYCRARCALVLPDIPRTALAGIGLSYTFRRFFSDGRATARIEVGIGVGKVRQLIAGQPLDAKGFLEFLHRVLDLPTCVFSFQKPAELCHLLLQGTALARLDFQASTPASAAVVPRPRWIPVQAGVPMVFVEYSDDEVEALPSTARPLPLADSRGLKLAFATVPYSRTAVAAWLLGGPTLRQTDDGKTSAASPLARNIRLCLFRLHAEYQVFKEVLRLIRGGAIRYERGTPAGDALDLYLSDARKWLFSSDNYGVDQSQFRELMLGFDSLVTADEKALLLQQLEAIRPQNLRALDRDIAPRGRPPAPQPGDFDVFISYNSKDVDEVTGIVRQLESHGIRPWFDGEEVEPGTRVIGALNDVLSRVPTAAVFLGDHGLGAGRGLNKKR